MEKSALIVFLGVLACTGCGSNDATTGAAAPASAAASSSSGAGGSGGAGGGGGMGGSGGMGEDWSCVGTVMYPTPSPMITVFLTLKEFVSMAPLDGATVKVCPMADVDCAMPLDTQVTDASGEATLTVDSTKFGYIEITSPTLFPTLNFFEHLPASANVTIGIEPPSTATVNALFSLVGETGSPTRGHAAVTAIGCELLPAPGVTIDLSSADSMTHTYYFKGGAPSKTATATDASGLAGIVNIPPGPMTVATKVEATGMTISSYDAFVRAGAISSFNVFP